MKYFKLLSLILFLGFVVACEDDDDDTSSTPAGGNNNPNGNYVNANIDGKYFEVGNVLTSLDSNYIYFGGFNGIASYPQITLVVFKKLPAKTYNYPNPNFDPNLPDPTIFYYTNDSTSYVFNSGEFVISVNDTVNKRIEGTFSGKFYEFSFSQDADSILVTNGQFGTDYN